MTVPQEQAIRRDLAALYRLVAHFGWDDLIFTHISARVPGTQDQFLINPYGFLFEEITASCLVKVGLDGEKLDGSPHAVNPAGFTIHSAVHAARSDAHFVIHMHAPSGVGVSCQEEGLLPISQFALLVRERLAWHDYEGIALDLAERERIVADLGDKDMMMLRNHGTLALGRSAADAFLNAYWLEKACEAQLLAQSGGAALRFAQQEEGRPLRASEATLETRLWPALLRMLERRYPDYTD
jgi:ribulose-5-phosphate 4-epimerase/fuculose-1-phosphate aldolase